MLPMSFTRQDVGCKITKVISGIFPGEDLDRLLPDNWIVDRTDVR